MSEEPEIKSIPVGISPLGHCFVGRQLMLRERLTREQWSGYDQHADLICNNVLNSPLKYLP